MPLIRKLVQVGGSRGITLPKSWLEYIQKKHGVELKEVAIEVDQVLIIEPIITNKQVEEVKS